jgi:Dolichyl-phosphate-mannose-protein mannosyltransferase
VRWVGSRGSAFALFALALAVFALGTVFLPVYPGRDMGRYVETYVQLGYHVPILPSVLETRAPFAALGVSVPLQISGWAPTVLLALLYAGSIVAWASVAFLFGPRAALGASAALLLYPGYAILFHQLASDSLFAAGFAGWALLLARAVVRPSIQAFVFAGVAAGVLVLIRPANQIVIVMALTPLLVRAPWRDRLAWLAAFFIADVVVAQSWRVFAHHRYGDTVALKPSLGLLALAVALTPLLLRDPWRLRLAAVVAVAVVVLLAVRGWPGQSPSDYVTALKVNASNQFAYRAFELDKIMAPENGPASRRAANIVRRELLTKEPYRSYGVDVHEFFASGSDRVFGDFRGVVPGDELAAATREAIRRHPGKFSNDIAHTAGAELWSARVAAPEAQSSGQEQRQSPTQQYIVVKGRRLPRPSEDQVIPASGIGPALLTLYGGAREVWHSATEHEFVFDDPRDKRRYEKFTREVDDVVGDFPEGRERNGVVSVWNDASRIFPPGLIWLVVGAIALALRRVRGALAVIAPVVGGLIVIGLSALIAPAVPEYGAPVSPAFVVFGVVGLLGRGAA